MRTIRADTSNKKKMTAATNVNDSQNSPDAESLIFSACNAFTCFTFCDGNSVSMNCSICVSNVSICVNLGILP